MKKLLILLLLFQISCTIKPLMNRSEYTIIDTLLIRSSNYGNPFGYDVIIKIDSTKFSAFIDQYGNLKEIHRKLK